MDGAASGAPAGGGSAPWGPAHRAVLEARLRADVARRDALSPRQARALDGVLHALRPDSMDAAIPPRVLVDHDLDAPDGPVAAIAVGDVDAPTHMTWQVSGMGITAHTAAWGSAREAGGLLLAQRRAGAPRPCVVAWLGYPAPPWWRVLGDGPARRGAERLRAHLEGWERRPRPPHGGIGPAVHTAVEAHSYGTLVAAHALAGSAHRVDVLALSGAVGLPRRLARALAGPGGPAAAVFEARAPGDRLAWLGRVLAGRSPWPAVQALPVRADEAAGLIGVSGHNSARWRPETGGTTPRGYRDPGTVTLSALGRVTAGRGLDPRP